MTLPAHHPDGQPLAAERVAAARDRLPDLGATERLTGILGLLADPTRLRIVYALDIAEELCVGDLAIALGTSADSTGYALRVLRTAGLVSRRKDGRIAYYRLAEGFPEPLRQHCLLRLIDLTHQEHTGGG